MQENTQRVWPSVCSSEQGAGAASGLRSSDHLSSSFTFRMERDAAFTQKKAERACLRVHLREKYRLPKVRLLTQ